MAEMITVQDLDGKSRSLYVDENGYIGTKAIVGYVGNSGEFKDVTVQYPLPVDGDRVYCKDIDVNSDDSDMGDFTGEVCDFFDSLQTVSVNSTSNNPKVITIQFNQSIPFSFFAIGCEDKTKNFSNVKATIYGSAGAVRHTLQKTVDDDTKRNSQTFPISSPDANPGGNSIKIEFYTSDEVAVSNILFFKTINTNSRTQALNGLTETVENVHSVDHAMLTIPLSLHSKPIDVYLAQVIGVPQALASDTVIDSYEIEIESGHTFVATDDLYLAEDGTDPRSYDGKVLSVSGDTLTMDTPMDTVFTAAGAIVFEITKELNVDGSVTAQNFNITNGGEVPFHITRIIMHITDNNAMDDSKFGSLVALTRGVILRQLFADGTYNNIFNVKTNGELGELAFDKIYDPKAPAGVYGITVRMTFSGLDKHSTMLKLREGESLECLGQDDLTDLSSFRIMAEGRFGLPPVTT